ncbi:MAG: hypothetical protein IT473_08810, partial [Lysobacter sp.]|nr:hypothetical protein [Lysobacter sp.]
MQKVIQRERIDQELRNGLWSGVKACIWDNWSAPDFYGDTSDNSQSVESVVETIWLHLFKLPIDTIPSF